VTWLDLLPLAAFVPLYALLRSRFARLPLHMDTGFYVTNAAIAERRYRPFRGWNTFFSGNSRLVPEWVHSTLYLRCGAERYAAAFRALYTVLSLSAAVGYAAVAWALLGTPHAFWPSALISAALLAEPQYGAYFESAEAFEVAVQGLGLASLCWGSELGQPALGLAGLALLWLDALLIKSSAALPCALTTLAVALRWEALRWPALLCSLLAAAGLVALLRAAAPPAREKLELMRRHERYVRRNYKNPLRLLAVKIGFSAKLLAQAPLLPLLAAAGALVLVPQALTAAEGALCSYAAFALGSVAALLWQGNRVWYYMLPLLALCGPLGAALVLELERRVGIGSAGFVLLVGLGASVVSSLRKLRGRDVREHCRRVFSVYDRRGGAYGTRFAEDNFELMQACKQFRERVRGDSVLVVGGHNQAYLQLEAAYATPLVSVCELSQAVAGELGRFLPGVPAPRYVLDTCGALPSTRFGLEWLSRYRQVDSHGRMRLFERAETATSEH